jgi:hypothetical protein
MILFQTIIQSKSSKLADWIQQSIEDHMFKWIAARKRE